MKRTKKPSVGSLSYGKTVAESLGIKFDRETVQAEATNLLHGYFHDVATFLPDVAERVRFTSFANLKFDAYVRMEGEQPSVFFDEMLWDFFFGMNCAISLLTFESLTDEERSLAMQILEVKLRRLVNLRLEVLPIDAEQALLFDHRRVFPVANAMTMSMTGFVFLHEFAHLALEHHQKYRMIEQELEADAQAFQWLAELSQKSDQLLMLKVTPNFLCAPLISMRYLRLAESLGLIATGTETHPSAEQRETRLRDSYQAAATLEADNLYRGVCAAINAAANYLGKGKLN